MRSLILIPCLLVLTACAGSKAGRAACGSQLDAAWRELDLAKAEGFAGTVSYSKALTLITAAKGQQTVEAFRGCAENAQKARFYIGESRKGR